MNTTKQHLSQSYKACAARGCLSHGIYEMEILYIGRKGWFCEQCKDSFLRDGLLIQQATAIGDCHQGVNTLGND